MSPETWRHLVWYKITNISEGRADFFNKMESRDRRVFWNFDIIYQTTWHRNTEESNFHSHHHEEFKSQLSECVTALMLYFFLLPHVLLVHPQFCPVPLSFYISPHFPRHWAWAESYAYSAGTTKRVKGTRTWEKGKSMPVVTLVIRWSFGTNYAPTLKMEALMPLTCRNTLSNNRALYPRTENYSEKGTETHLQLQFAIKKLIFKNFSILSDELIKSSVLWNKTPCRLAVPMFRRSILHRLIEENHGNFSQNCTAASIVRLV
jgi:hypothetical protein